MVSHNEKSQYNIFRAILENSDKHDQLRFSERVSGRLGVCGIVKELKLMVEEPQYWSLLTIGLGTGIANGPYAGKGQPMAFIEGLEDEGYAEQCDKVYRLTDKGFEKFHELEKICESGTFFAA